MAIDANSSTEFLSEELTCHGCNQMNNTSPLYAIPIYCISLLSVVGNLLVICIIYRSAALHNNQGLYMISLAISDLGSAVIFAIFSGRYAITGEGPSTGLELDIGAGTAYMFLTASLFNVIAIGLDKLAQIEFTYGYERSWTSRKCLCLILGYWALLGGLSVLPTRIVPIKLYYYKFNSDTFTFVTVHNAKPSALVVVRMMLFAVLLLILFIGYGRLYCIARRHSRGSKHDANALQGQPGASGTGGNRIRVTRGTLTIGLVLTAWLLAWMPFFTVQIVLAMSKNLREYLSREVSFSMTWFAMLHTCSNFVIYGGTYRPFRRGLKRCLQTHHSSHF